MESVTAGSVGDGLRPRSIAIVKHAHTPSGGAEDSLFAYLQERADTCAMLAHPFPGARGVGPHSRWRVCVREGADEDVRGWRGRGPAVWYYVRDVAETLRRFLFARHRWDVFVGVDNLNATLGVFLRWFGRTRTVVFYVIDYVPQRFRNPFMNALYHALDRFAARRADCTWNVGAGMAEARAERGMPPDRAAPQLTVPMGAPLPSGSVLRAKVPTAVYLGHLVEEQGVDLLLDAWPRVAETVPGATLWIVGSGPDRHRLGELADQLGLAEFVHWLGYIPEERLHEVLGPAWVAVAPYPRTTNPYKRYADPGKLRWYAAAGLPTIITDVPAAAAEQIAHARTGLVCEPTVEGLATAVRALLTNSAQRADMSATARRLAESYTWDAIFDAAWAASWPHLEARWGER